MSKEELLSKIEDAIENRQESQYVGISIVFGLLFLYFLVTSVSGYFIDFISMAFIVSTPVLIWVWFSNQSEEGQNKLKENYEYSYIKQVFAALKIGYSIILLLSLYAWFSGPDDGIREPVFVMCLLGWSGLSYVEIKVKDFYKNLLVSDLVGIDEKSS